MRGIIEGFYGTPWSAASRQEVMAFLGQQGLTHYLFGPKDDPLFRDAWRMPFAPEDLSRFDRMNRDAKANGMMLGVALSPGLDIEFGNAEEVRRLTQKFLQLADIGIRWFGLFWDDIDPTKSPRDLTRFPDPGYAQSWVTNEVKTELGEVAQEPWLFCPTEYWTAADSPYRAAVKASLHPDVRVMWTGPGICSERITAEAAAAVTSQFGHPLVIWDNYPVNDAEMVNELHLGPLDGRAPDLLTVVDGYLANPMDRPHASLVALGTIAAYLRDPQHYDPWRAWTDALGYWGREVRVPLERLGRATLYSCCGRGSEWDREFLRAVRAGQSPSEEALQGVLACGTLALEDFPESLRDELGPWIEKVEWVARWLKATLDRDAESARRYADECAKRPALVFSGTVERWLTMQTDNLAQGQNGG